MPAALNGAGFCVVAGLIRDLDDVRSPVRSVVRIVFLCRESALGPLDKCFGRVGNVGAAAAAAARGGGGGGGGSGGDSGCEGDAIEGERVGEGGFFVPWFRPSELTRAK